MLLGERDLTALFVDLGPEGENQVPDIMSDGGFMSDSNCSSEDAFEPIACSVTRDVERTVHTSIEWRQPLCQLWSTVWQMPLEDVQRRIKPQQFDAIERLFKRNGLILLAPTGFGKSLIFHSILLLVDGGVAIIVYPLDALEEGQKCEIDKLPNARSVILNANSANERVFKDVAGFILVS